MKPADQLPRVYDELRKLAVAKLAGEVSRRATPSTPWHWFTKRA
jgi:hypothetical protein